MRAAIEDAIEAWIGGDVSQGLRETPTLQSTANADTKRADEIRAEAESLSAELRGLRAEMAALCAESAALTAEMSKDRGARKRVAPARQRAREGE